MIYLDHNATTPLHPEVAHTLARAAGEAVLWPCNPSSVHQGGRRARARLDGARERAAKVLHCEPKEICFTGSGSEADALAVSGGFHGRQDKARTKIVVSSIEHPAVLLCARQLEAEGAQVVRVPPSPLGLVDPERFIAELEGAALASLMWANNETGVLQPVAEVARACRERGVLFHTDAVQAVGKVPVSLREAQVDLLALSGHKLGAPAGVGLLFVRKGVELRPLVQGHQEGGRRGGTHNLAYLEALVQALELAAAAMSEQGERLGRLRDRLESEVLARMPEVAVNGGGAPRLPNTSNLRFGGADGEALLIGLDLEGICASAGAACASGSLTPSHVLCAMGLSPRQAHESLRLSLGPTTTPAEVDEVISALCRQVERARQAA